MEEIPLPLRSRAIASYKALLAGTTDPKARLQIVLTLAEFGDSDTPTRLKDELAGLPPAIVRALSDHSLRPAVEIVRRVDPQWASQWVADRIVEGALRPDNWLGVVSSIPELLSERLLQRVCTESLQRGGSAQIISLLATTADAEFAKTVFAKLCDHRRQLSTDARNEEKQAVDGQLKYLFQALPAPVAVGGLSNMLAGEPNGFELSIVTEMFSRMGSQEDDLRGALPDTLCQQLRRYLKAGVSEVLNQDDFWGEAKARLASALAEVGETEDMADLLTLIRADIERVRNGRAARAHGDRTARGQGGMTSYSNWHVQALIRLGQTKAEPALIDLLNEPEYELDAAWALVTIAKRQVERRPVVAGRFVMPAREYRKLRTETTEWSMAFKEDKRTRYADAVSQRLLDILKEGPGGNQDSRNYRLKELTKVLATLDPKRSADLILEIAELPAKFDGWNRVGLLEGLLFGGVVLPADRVMSILGPAIAEFRTQGIYDNNSASLFGRLLCMLPFVDPRAAGIAHIRELLSEFRPPLYNQTNLMMALGQSTSADGLALLRDLARDNMGLFQNSARDWVEAVAACPLPQARLTLLGFIDPEVTEGVAEVSVPDYAVDLLAARLSDLAQADRALAERILQLCNQPVSHDRRLTIAKVIARLNDPRSLPAGLDLIDDSSPEPIPYDLWKAIEDVVLEKRPYKGNPQSYSRAPRAANDIKKRLFEMASSDPRRTRSAYNLLGQIEEWRLEYGRPNSEPSLDFHGTYLS